MARRVLYLVRHGETDWNAEGRWQGQTDIPLNDNGYAQARAVAKSLRSAGLGAVVSSDLSRAYDTARVAAQQLGVAVAYLDHDLRERAFGVFEGLTREECALYHPGPWRAWIEERKAPEGGEDQQILVSRMMGALRRAAERAFPDGIPILIVTHGGALRATLAEAIGVVPPPIANGAIWRVEWQGKILSAELLSALE
jgi:broad specificity phosphatase PhoE